MVVRGGWDNGLEGELIVGDEGGLWEVNLSSVEERVRVFNERVIVVEVVVGLVVV